METTNRTDRDENEVRRAEAIITVMDAYLASRSPEPGKSQLGEEYTEEIADELHSIMPIRPMDIVLYLQGEGYELKTAEDGTLRWELWRDMHYML